MATTATPGHVRVGGGQQGGGGVGNIAYEQESADVTRYTATYWIEDIGGGNFDQLQYSQTIMLRIPIPGIGPVDFPHITTNTLTRTSGGLTPPYNQ